MTNRIYLDNNATTAVLPEVRDAVVQALSVCGNPSSLHASGRAPARRRAGGPARGARGRGRPPPAGPRLGGPGGARGRGGGATRGGPPAGGRAGARLLSGSRADVARWLGCRPTEVVFTSGGTEADRLAILGAIEARPERRHVVASAIEHSAVRDLLAHLERAGRIEVTWVRPDPDGAVRADAFAAALRDDTVAAALLWASNETGVLQPVEDAAKACRSRGVSLCVDAVQAAGKVPIDFRVLDADLVAVSAHKVHGPRGVGALLVREGSRWKPPFPSHHEARRRAGTEALPAIAGFAAAARVAASQPPEAWIRVGELRDRLERVLCGALEGVRVNGSAARIFNTSNVVFAGVESDRLLAMLDRAGIDASGGSACSAASPEPSHVLLAMGLPRRDALSAVRFSLSRLTTSDEIDRAAAATIECVETLRRQAGGRRLEAGGTTT